jgi:DNA-binding CsgD family transcriptional regulator
MVTRSPMRRRRAQLKGRRRERDVLERLIEAVRSGGSRALVVHGEPGAGKTALLEYLVERASGCRTARAGGVQSEMEVAFSGLNQLLVPMLDRVERLPVPQRDALQTAFGVTPGPAPDRLFVGLAVLGLLSEVAEERPLICVVDDEQWLDRASAQVLAFVARRLGTEAVGMVFATRGLSPELAGLAELAIDGLRESDARALLESALTGPLDARVRDQIVSETRGNPLALLELPRGLTPAELAGGFGLPDWRPLSSHLEETFRRRLDTLPADTRRLLALAAADPTGEPLLLWRAAERLAIGTQDAAPAVEAAMVEFGARVRFRHPLVRSAAYLSASLRERQAAHRALAEVTDPQLDPERRAWHRALAAPGPDEDVAEELERSASRAQDRGGLAAAAAFLESAAMLTPLPGRRAQRLLAAAGAKRDAGALDAALELLVAAEAGPLDPVQAAEVEHLRGQIALEQQRGVDAARLLLGAAVRLEPLNAALARETHLEALVAALWTGDVDTPGCVLAAAEGARAGPGGPKLPRPVDALLDALAIRVTDGYTAAAPALTKALELVLAPNSDTRAVGHWPWLADSRPSALVALELWDADAWQFLADRLARAARQSGALVHLRLALNFSAGTSLLAGELTVAAVMVEEDRLIAEATGNTPIAYVEMILEAWRGREKEASELIEATVREADASGLGRFASFAMHANSVLHNGLGRYEVALTAARQAFEPDHIGLGAFVVPELAEAASRTGDEKLVEAALNWLSERTRVTPTDWVLGIEARVRAFLSPREAADSLYRESIDRLGRTRVRVELARSHLLFGEWLRREHRRTEAREQLRTAYEMLSAMGTEAFAERARRELLATGGSVRRRTVETRDELTPQEAEIARLARDGLSNPEIGERLFISRRTVEYHLHKVFAKLGISSRNQLHRALGGDPSTEPAALGPQ